MVVRDRALGNEEEDGEESNGAAEDTEAKGEESTDAHDDAKDGKNGKV